VGGPAVVYQALTTPEGLRSWWTQTGFDKVPPDRRMEAFRMNSGGWEAQLNNIERYATTR